MKTSIRIALCAMMLLLPRAVQAQTASGEEVGVRAALNAYLQAHATGSGSHIENVFHPRLQMMWVAGDTVSIRSAAQYIAGFRGQPQPDEAQRRRWIESIDISGNAAMAKVVLDYPDRKFVDYFALLKTGTEWKIVSKVFSSEAKR